MGKIFLKPLRVPRNYLSKYSRNLRGEFFERKLEAIFSIFWDLKICFQRGGEKYFNL